MKALLSSTLVLIILLTCANSVFAKENQSFKAQQNQFFLQISPGKQLNEILIIENLIDSKQSLNVSFQGYKLPDNFVINQTYLTNHSIDFAKFSLEQINLEPYQTIQLPIGFNPSDNLPAGDYYGKLILANSLDSISVDFTIRLLGKLNEIVAIDQIKSADGKLVFTIINSGNISSNFFLTTKLDKLFDSDVEKNFSKQSIKAGEIKEISLNFGKLLPGYYQSQTSLKFGSKETETTKLYSFWVKGEFFLVSALTLIISILVVWIVKRSSRHA